MERLLIYKVYLKKLGFYHIHNILMEFYLCPDQLFRHYQRVMHEMVLKNGHHLSLRRKINDKKLYFSS